MIEFPHLGADAPNVAKDIARMKAGLFGLVLALLLLAPAGCTSEDYESPGQGEAPGDFMLTVVVVSPTEVELSWDDPSTQFLQRPLDLYSEVLRDGVSLVTTHEFAFTDSGAAPGTQYCYEVVVLGIYEGFFPGSAYSYGWASNDVCVVTPGP